jgi:hypothetical protein
MAPETILSVLSRRNPILKPWRIGPAPNTLGRNWLDIERWQPWSEFNAKELQAIYKDIIQAPWQEAPHETRISDFDATYGDEDGYEHQVLGRTTIPVVNAALSHAQKLCNHASLLHLGRRGRCRYGEDNRINPDWALVNNVDFLPDGKFAPLLAGDTKLGSSVATGTLSDQLRAMAASYPTNSHILE